MAKRPITDYYFTYKEYLSDSFVDPIQCNTSNTRINEDGTATIIAIPNINIQSGDFKVILLNDTEISYNEENFYDKEGIPKVNIIISDPSIINRDSKVEADLVITNGYNSNYSNDKLYNGKIQIKIRGNSSALAPKKPYSIYLLNSLGEDNDCPLFGMNASSDWALLAEWDDYTLVRTKTICDLGNYLNSSNWYPSDKIIEVYINGEYNGVYTIIENVKRKSYRVDVSKLSPTDNSLPKMSGGYILEQTLDAQEDPETDNYFKTPITSQPYLNSIYSDNYHSQRIDYPKFGEISNEQLDYIKNYVLSFENALYNVAFDDLENGYRAYLDIPSAVDYYLVQELTRNVDGPSHSLYYSKQRGEKIKMGPIWDLNYSLYPYVYFGHITDPSARTGFYMETNFWYRQLLIDPYFSEQVRLRYAQIKDTIKSKMIEGINKYKLLLLSGAVERNYTMWDNIPQPYLSNYLSIINNTFDFIEARTNYFDNQFLN